MTYIMILIVSHAVTKIDFDSKLACSQAKVSIEKEMVMHDERFIVVCTPKGKSNE